MTGQRLRFSATAKAIVARIAISTPSAVATAMPGSGEITLGA